MTTLFISDLHLDPEYPEVTRLFDDFLQEYAPRAEALYILGDLFEVWLGDDDDRPALTAYVSKLRILTKGGTRVYVMHGNRDFLIGTDFAAATGCELLGDHEVIDLHGTRTLLLHGDTLCSDDVEYQKFRAMVHDSTWQAEFLDQPLQQRVALAQRYREASREYVRSSDTTIMDVNQEQVARTMREYQVTHMIHGHTHRPAVHEFTLDGERAQRMVLGDWGNSAMIAVADSDGCRLTRFTSDATQDTPR